MRALLVLTIAACSSSPPPPLSGRASGEAPQTPPPALRFADGRFATTGLPAVARSRELVALAFIDKDGGRGNPNLRLDIRDRWDKSIEQINVLTANEVDTFVPDGVTAGAVLEARIASANYRLAQLHADADLLAMTESAAPVGANRASPIEGGGLTLSLSADHVLHVRRDGQVIASVDGKAWLAPKSQRCPVCPVCENPPYLAAFYKAPGIDALVARIAYEGTDTCWEPPDQLHIVIW